MRRPIILRVPATSLLVVSLAFLLAACVAPAASSPVRRNTQSPTPSPSPSPVVAVATKPPSDGRVFVLCDSVLLAAQSQLRQTLRGWQATIDCKAGRRLTQGLRVLEARRAEIGGVVVVHMGNNFIAGEGGTFAQQIDRLMALVPNARRVVWVTVAEKWTSRVAINRAIREAAARHPTIRIAEWAPVCAAHPEYTFDGLHLTAYGRAPISRLVAAAVGNPA